MNMVKAARQLRPTALCSIWRFYSPSSSRSCSSQSRGMLSRSRRTVSEVGTSSVTMRCTTLGESMAKRSVRETRDRSMPSASTTQLITRSDGNRRQTSFRFRSFSLQDGHLRGFSRGERVVAREGFFGRFRPPETPKSLLVLRFFSASKGHGNYYHCVRTHSCSLFLRENAFE